MPTIAPESALKKYIGRVTGQIVKKDATYCLVRSTVYPKAIYANEVHTPAPEWEAIRTNTTVTLEIRFKRNGPVGHDLARLP